MMRVETSLWSAEEIEAYQQAMVKYDKDFFLVSKQVTAHVHMFTLYCSLMLTRLMAISRTVWMNRH